MKLLKKLTVTALTFSLCAASAIASTWPDKKPITMIVPFPAGSGTDSVARIFAREMGTRLDTNVVVDNKPGANGAIAAQHVVRSKPDGYTILISTNTPLSAAPWLTKSIPYDVTKDFTPIARGGNLPFILIVNSKQPFKSVKELIDYAKANPGKLTYASGNSTGIVSGATLANRAGIDILHVPYKGTPQAITDLIGGQVDFMFTDLTSGLPFVQNKNVNALAVSTAAQSVLMPDLPSMQQAGVNDFDINSWNGFLGPADMPQDVVDKLNATINDIVKNPDVKAELAKLGFDAFSGTQEEFAKFVLEQYELWGKLIKEAGIAAN